MNHLSPQTEHAEAARRMIEALAGAVDPVGVELRRAVRMTANQYDAIEDEKLRELGLSGPRWGLLLRLMGEEQLYGRTDVSPTYLSRCLHVSKNTVSALLASLEEQGLIARALDPEDRRVFRIQLTDAGRAMVRATAPEHIAFLNHLAAGLTAEERAQLIALLDKLHAGLKATQSAAPTQSAALS